jgi:hypothetical protein
MPASTPDSLICAFEIDQWSLRPGPLDPGQSPSYIARLDRGNGDRDDSDSAGGTPWLLAGIAISGGVLYAGMQALQPTWTGNSGGRGRI